MIKDKLLLIHHSSLRIPHFSSCLSYPSMLNFPSVELPLTFPARAREAQPAREEREAADGRDRAEPALPRQAQKIQTAGEDDCARDEEPARGGRERAGPT